MYERKGLRVRDARMVCGRRFVRGCLTVSVVCVGMGYVVRERQPERPFCVCVGAVPFYLV